MDVCLRRVEDRLFDSSDARQIRKYMTPVDRLAVEFTRRDRVFFEVFRIIVAGLGIQCEQLNRFSLLYQGHDGSRQCGLRLLVDDREGE